MQTQDIHAAKTHFSALVEAAASGETIITKAGAPAAKLVPVTPTKRRRMLSKVTLNAEASDAMDPDVAELFESTRLTL